MRINLSLFFLIKMLLIFLLLLNFKCVFAQTDSTITIKSYQNQDSFLTKFENFKTSQNLVGLQDVAEHHHYPAPQKVLKWQKELQLNDRQKVAIKQINEAFQKKVNEMNNFLITNEKALDNLFRLKQMNNGMLIFYTNRYGLYQGELRNALLQACLKTELQLTDIQIKKYDSLLQH